MKQSVVGMLYYAHGVYIESNVDLPQFAPCSGGTAGIKLSFLRSSEEAFARDVDSHQLVEGYYEKRSGEYGDFFMFDHPDSYQLTWSSIAEFMVSKDGSLVSVSPLEGAPWDDIRPFFVGRILPFALNLRGVATLHAGAVGFSKGAAGFLAHPGTGKSTLVASLVASGHRMVTDDVLSIYEANDQFSTVRGSSQVRLTGESLRKIGDRLKEYGSAEYDYDKFRYSLSDNGEEDLHAQIPLGCLYLLKRRPERHADIRIRRLEPVDALALLMRRSTNARFLQQRQVKLAFKLYSKLVTKVPVKVLEFPSDYKAIPEVCSTLLLDQKSWTS